MWGGGTATKTDIRKCCKVELTRAELHPLPSIDTGSVGPVVSVLGVVYFIMVTTLTPPPQLR